MNQTKPTISKYTNYTNRQNKYYLNKECGLILTVFSKENKTNFSYTVCKGDNKINTSKNLSSLCSDLMGGRE